MGARALISPSEAACANVEEVPEACCMVFVLKDAAVPEDPLAVGEYISETSCRFHGLYKAVRYGGWYAWVPLRPVRLTVAPAIMIQTPRGP